MNKRLILVFGIACLMAACTTKPIHTINDQLVPTSASQGKLDIKDVEVAILRGARNKGWSARVVSPGLIEAAIMVRSHRAVVEIPHSAEHFSIIYKDSENLDYKDGGIHRNYNKWVINLSASIQNQLGTM